jgi:methionyl-tRNA formyltransferase
MKKVVFLGERFTSFKYFIGKHNYHLVSVITTPHSRLESELKKRAIKYKAFTKRDKKPLINYLTKLEFDLFISNGNPFILPISEIKRKNQIFINIHPSLLPKLKGKSPVNGVFLFSEREFGVTVHHMDDGIDTGDIILQEKILRTSDLDLGLVYYLTFLLEERIIGKALKLLEDKQYKYRGKMQVGDGSYYSRQDKDCDLNFSKMKKDEILKRIQSFGVPTQGANFKIGDIKFKAYDAEIMKNNFIKELGDEISTGEMVLKYPNGFLIKCLDGIIKIKQYKEIDE